MLDQGMVPTARVAPFLRRYLEESDDPASDSHGSLPRILKRWENEQEWAEFTSVDRIFCLISDTPVMLWLQIEDVYYGCAVDACRSRVKFCERVGCSNPVVKKRPGGHPKRFCSGKCRRATGESRRRGGYAVRAYGPHVVWRDGTKGGHLTGLECAKGHPYTEETIYVTRAGHRACKTCQRKASREYARRKRAASTTRLAA